MIAFTTEMLVVDFRTGKIKQVEGPDIISTDLESAELYLITKDMTWCRIVGIRNDNEIQKFKTSIN